jgi:hypothetical protein
MTKKKEPSKVGRPTVFTDEVIRKIEEVAALDGSVGEMAYYAGINVQTLYSYIQDHEEFSQRIAALRERPVLKARQTIVKGLDVPEFALKYVERKRRHEFSTRIEQDVTSQGEKIVILPSEIYAKHDAPSEPGTDSK